jgi:hypothetical protein
MHEFVSIFACKLYIPRRSISGAIASGICIAIIAYYSHISKQSHVHISHIKHSKLCPTNNTEDVIKIDRVVAHNYSLGFIILGVICSLNLG